MRASKEFKQEFNQEYAEVKYSITKILLDIVKWVLILGIILGCFGFGFKYFSTNADREIFKQSVTYNEGMLDDLAKYRMEMIEAEPGVEQEAIQDLINNRFANFDESKIESRDLRNFLNDCREGVYNAD